MADIRRLGRAADGRLFWLPWVQRIADAPTIVTLPSISGTSSPGQTVTAVGGTYLPASGLTKSFDWTLKSTAGATADYQTGSTYKIPAGAPTGKLILREIVRGVGNLQVIATVEVAITSIAGAPSFTSNPVISMTSGTGGVGSILNVVNGSVTGSPAPTVSRQWYRDGVAISGATAQTLTTTAVGVHICRNTASNGIGTPATADSNSITIASTGAPVFTSTPTLSRNATSGEFTATLATATGTPVPTTGNWWFTGDSATGPWTARTTQTTNPLKWIPIDSYSGKWVTCATKASNSVASNVESAKATPIQIPAEGFIDSTPLISGGPAMGSVLALDTASFTYRGAPTVTYAWLRGTTTLSTTTTSRTTGPDDVGNDLTCVVTLTYASGNVFTATSNKIRVTAAAAWPALSTAAATAARAVGHTSYNVNANGLTNNAYTGPPEPFLAYATWQGAAADNRARLVEAMKRNIKASDNVDPCFKHGFSSQMELGFAGSAYFCKADPNTWSEFSADEKNRIDTLMNLDAVTAATCARTGRSGESNNNMIGQPNYATETGNGNPNFRCAPRAHLAICAAYMGGGSTLKTYLDGIESQDITDLYEALTDYGLGNAAGSIAPTGRPSGSPSYSHIVSKCHNFTTGGLDLTNLAGIWRNEMNFAYGKNAMTGLNGGRGSDDDPGRGKFGTSVTNYARYTAIDGEAGMVHELDTTDEGGQRSSVRYSYWATYVTTIWTIVGLAAGQISRTDSANAPVFRRMFVGNEFNQIATIKTWLETSHAKEPDKRDASTWNTSKATTYGYVQRDGLADVIDVISGNRAA